MVLVFFWMKAAIRRIIPLFKSSPIIVIWAFLLVFVFIVAQRNVTITLNTQTLSIVVPFLILYSLFNSLHNYDVVPTLLRNSKSKNSNRMIHARFFVKRALINNILLLVFTVIAFYKMEEKNFFTVIAIACVFSVILSFLLMYLKNMYMKKRIAKGTTKRTIVNPSIKSIVYDYLTSDFLLIAAVCAVLFLIVVLEFAKSTNALHEMENPLTVFSAMLIISSLGFMGIIESTAHINWKFQAIASPNDYTYHIKRTAIFLGIFLGWMVIPFVLMIVFFNITLLFKYLFCMFVLFFTSIFTAFTTSNMLIKVIILILIAIFTAWISTLEIWFLLILLVPVVILFLKSKSEYREWGLL